jgi:hypothetical protein
MDLYHEDARILLTQPDLTSLQGKARPGRFRDEAFCPWFEGCRSVFVAHIFQTSILRL